jgi:hypothetical protein
MLTIRGHLPAVQVVTAGLEHRFWEEYTLAVVAVVGAMLAWEVLAVVALREYIQALAQLVAKSVVVEVQILVAVAVAVVTPQAWKTEVKAAQA